MLHNHLTKRVDDQDFKSAVEEALFDHSSTIGLKSVAMSSSRNQADEADKPVLSLVPKGDATDAQEREEDRMESSDIHLEAGSADEDHWPWGHDGGEDLLASNNATEAGRRVEIKSNEPESVEAGDDQSATEDLVLCEPQVAQAVMLKLKAPEKPEAAIPISESGVRQSGVAPKRIGSGTLVPARLTWKPGDPFGENAESAGPRFRWELMLRSACITAACGLFCVWLLHSIFA